LAGDSGGPVDGCVGDRRGFARQSSSPGIAHSGRLGPLSAAKTNEETMRCVSLGSRQYPLRNRCRQSGRPADPQGGGRAIKRAGSPPTLAGVADRCQLADRRERAREHGVRGNDDDTL
jgi:hypothetical protein